MSRLIDADELIKAMEKIRLDDMQSVEMFIKVSDVINAQPTAYNKKKVEKKVIQEFKKYYGANYGKAPYLVKVVELIREGGVENNK